MSSYKVYLKLLPWECEANAIKALLSQTIQSGGQGKRRLHILNVSANESLQEVTRAKKVTANINITSSVPAHHFFFNSSDVDNNDTRFKCLPPIRDEANCAALIQALIHDEIDIITSSHFGTLPQLKGGCANFLRAMPGVSTLGYMKTHIGYVQPAGDVDHIQTQPGSIQSGLETPTGRS